MPFTTKTNLPAASRHRRFKQLLRIMQLTCILLLAFCLHLSANVHSQITLSAKDQPLEQVFRQIEQQSGYDFLYGIDVIKQAGKISIELKNVTVDKALASCLAGKPLTFEINEKTVVIRKKSEVPRVELNEAPPITGIVRGPDGQPLVGVNVQIKGASKGTATDANGRFTLEVKNGDYLIISNVGYGQKEIKVDGNDNIIVDLAISTNPLDEVQIIAYGTTSKRLNTGNVSTVKAEDIAKQPVSNPLAALQGRVPGMIITQTTGMPGGAFSVQIRGQNSIENGTDPLYIVDGVPYISQFPGNLNPSGGGNPLNMLNPAEIESIDVLKDADATAIYGSRGANGVVLISTKKGKAGELKVKVNVYAGAGKITRKLDLLNTQQYLQVRHEALKNDGIVPDEFNSPDLVVWDTTRYTDWQDELVGGTAKYTDAQTAISGGNKNTQYVFGGGYHRETTVFPGNSTYQKGSARFNITSRSNNEKFKALFTGTYTSENNSMPNYDPLLDNGIFLAPDAPPIYNDDGSLNWAHSTWTNPFYTLQSKMKGLTNNLIGNANIGYELFKGFNISVNLGVNNLQLDQIAYRPTTYYDPAYNITSGSTDLTNFNRRSWIVEPKISFEQNFRFGRINILGGATFQDARDKSQNIQATGFASDALLQNIQAASTLRVFNLQNNQYRYGSIFGRVNYNYKEKYLLNFTGRRDGSSRFGPGKQFANFGAVGAGWIFTNEAFVSDNVPFLSFGKFRGSYGTSGNDMIGDYRFLDLYTATSIPYQGAQGLYPTNLPNPDLAWEENKKLEAGLELGFVKDKIIITASWYRNRSSNQLIGYDLPEITGFGSITRNLPALVQNKGWEFTLNTKNIQTKNFSWGSSFNLSFSKNTLLQFPGLSTSSYRFRYIIGQSLNILQLFEMAGVDPQTGVYQFIDSKGNSTFAPDFAADRRVYLNMNPKYYGGFQNNFSYKGLELDFLLQFVKQPGRNSLFSSNFNLPGIANFNPMSQVLDRWQKPGDIAPAQIYTTSYSSAAFRSYRYAVYSSNAYTDASFIRLKNVSISYNVPGIICEKMHFRQCRVYFQGQNLITFTRYAGLDPENQNAAALPPLRVLTGGIQLTF